MWVGLVLLLMFTVVVVTLMIEDNRSGLRQLDDLNGNSLPICFQVSYLILESGNAPLEVPHLIAVRVHGGHLGSPFVGESFIDVR